MKNIKICNVGLLLALAVLAGASHAAAQGSAFNYQGKLDTNGVPANGFYDFEFSLYPNEAGTGSPLGLGTITQTGLGVTNGLFSATLNFGAVFNGNAIWLAMSVRSNGVGSYAALSPLQPLLPVPYAAFANASSNLSGTLPAVQLSGAVANSQLANNSITVNAGTGLSGGGGVALGGSTTLNNTGVLSVAGNADITAATAGGAVTLGDTATSAATPNLIVKRDGSGNFSAGTITLSGALNMVNSGENTAVGAGTLGDNTTGFYNTANGAYALYYNTAGYYNTASGAYALEDNTNGYFNTADGVYALAFNTNGGYNTASGALALYLNNGSYNTANGADALIDNTTGNYNTASGTFALYLNTNGWQNTANGAFALEYNRIGNNNLADGYSALQQLGENGAGGSNNIALGYLAGSAYTGNESSNIDIGHIGVAGESYTMRLGTPGVISNAYIAGAIIGNGIGLSNLNGSLVTEGTIPLAQLPATVALLSDPGTANFFAGQYAGNSGLSGSRNTGTGYAALDFTTSGSDNTAQGFGALEFNSTGSNNAAFGAYALNYNTTGNNNTGTGAYALSAYTVPGDLTANGNTADGAYALTDDESGYNNTAVGYQSLQNNTSGFDNVAVGVNALQDLDSDSLNDLNTAVGTYAMPAMTAGQYNTGIGAYSLYNLTNGVGNIGLGIYAGYFLEAGTNNIYIGNYGSTADNNTIRIGESPNTTYINGTTTYLTGAQTYINGVIALDGSDTNNGLEYLTSGLIGVPTGAGPFLYGFDGGALGSGGPTSVSLSWDWTGNVWVSNNLSTATLTIRGGSDLAEPFRISSGNDNVPQGSVMVIDEENAGQLKVCTQAYDTRVAGVISGANGINPGIQMQQQGLLEGGKNVALTGRVYVLADAANGAIKPGDLLTTSDTPGHAMKVSDHAQAQGAILGKAMSGLKQGRGMVLVLVTLQ